MSKDRVYELLEECIASKDSMKLFLTGYRFFYTADEVWQAIQNLYNNYFDAKPVRNYIWRCLQTWFRTYCLQDFKNNRDLANKVFDFASKKFKDKKLTSRLKTLFIEEISQEEPPPISVPSRWEEFGQPVYLYNGSSTSIEEVVNALDSISLNFVHSLSLGENLKKEMAGTGAALFDHIVYYVATHIMWGKQTKERAREYQFFVKVAIKLRWKRNYEMAFAVYQGLIHTSVKKLTRTLKRVSNSSNKSLATLDFLFDPRGGYENYRREVKDIKTVYTPILAILQRQLQNVRGVNSPVKIIGKVLTPLVKLKKSKPLPVDDKIRGKIFQPPFSKQKLEELVSLRENPSFHSSSSSSSEYSDHEMSPRPFGTPRIPTLPISETIPTRPHSQPHSPLRKTISFSERSSSDGSLRSPRPISRSRIVRTRKIRDLKKQLRNPEYWTCERVGEWLQDQYLGEYELDFLKAKVDGSTLLKINKKSLVDIGVNSEDAIKLLKKIQNLSEN